MTWNIEESVIKRAIRKGLLRLDDLREKGLMDQVIIDTLMEELAEEDSVAQGLEKHMQFRDRYRSLEFLGRGAMAEVYRAYDQLLSRHVALKFLRVDNPDLRSRLVMEARLQARVDHPHVCKVYEVGEFEDGPYIAMQYINGKTLKEVKDQLSLEQKVKLIQQVAEAVHAAHGMGLIHRDLKPGNVMVERSESGHWIPYVMDFGLAREAGSEGGTVTGAVIGTPSYMSPEQAGGDVRNLDRRTDVYSLGATLYDVLTGHPPFEGASGMQIILKILNEAPEPLRKHDSQIPRDLEAIVMKCLEEQRVSRYVSARALAEDLGRYLSGDPVTAQAAGRMYWIRKKARKHKVLLSLAALAFFSLAISGAVSLRARWVANQRMEMGQELGREIETMEWIMRAAFLMPPHDVRREEAVVKDKMRNIEKRMKEWGNIALGPGSYALGRGSMALGNYQEARARLEQAWKEGYREPEVAYFLGRVLGEQYREGLEAAHQGKRGEELENEKERLIKEYRSPALAFLRKGGGQMREPPEYAEALIAFYEENFDEALWKLQAVQGKIGWFYEAIKVQGDIHQTVAMDHMHKGEYEEGEASYQKALKAYGQAMQVGRSDPLLYESSCRARAVMLRYLVQLLNRDVSDAAVEATAVCECAQAMDPSRYSAYDNLGAIQAWLGSSLLKHGENPVQALERAIHWGQQALEKGGQQDRIQINLGIAWLYKGDYEEKQGLDPRSSWENALRQFKKVQELSPNNAVSYVNSGDILLSFGLYESKHGADPRQQLREAISDSRRALELQPRLITAHGNMGQAYGAIGEYEMHHGLSPAESFRLAQSSLEEALKINSRVVSLYITLGSLFRNRSHYECSQGLNPKESWKTAMESYRKALALDLDSKEAQDGIATLSGKGPCDD